ncbi:fam-a protein [Plasmodium berghei]|uniref:Fam-a protein n=1 Tax=Plasmodium berghei TaxID=5821 RepID=A0A1D3L7B9_PLABE|nr:fam-a protein [Plasmodium berghei]
MSIFINGSPEELYEKNKHLLCTDPEETIKAGDVMNEAVKHLEHHAANIDDYRVYERDSNSSLFLFKKKHQSDPDIKKMHYIARKFYEYNEIINMSWDPDYANFLNTGSFKIVRVYNPNLVMVQQRYEDSSMNCQKYFYALAAYVEISKDKTIIVRVSADINDHNPSNEKYKNEIVKSASLFKTEIDSEDDIRKGELKKMFVNIAGYLIENKGDCVNITYVESINRHCTI